MLVKQIEKYLLSILEERKQQSLFRSLRTSNNLVDFCSNDYLGFSQKIKQDCENYSFPSGATGSRLLAGNTKFIEDLEQEIANFHGAETGLIFNSGYDANVGLLSCIPQKNDILITDELIHASMIDGARLSYATRYKFKHNDIESLEFRLSNADLRKDNLMVGITKSTFENNSSLETVFSKFIAIESVYSMDGDLANLTSIVNLSEKYGANLIVDEAHATGIFGKNGRGLVCELGLEDKVFARVVTFGKALGCHGAIVLGSKNLRDYLVNFARSFIYTTAAPMHTHESVRQAYQLLKSPDFSNKKLHHLIHFFKEQAIQIPDLELIESISAIQCIIISGNEKCREVAMKLQNTGLDIRPIVSPTVPKGKERLRICMHEFNTEEEILRIFEVLKK
ncbi:MAG: 8-amino-7-oxononanoate synthase [Arcicella sp.]|nr:8-amino-7-oxononanoate synthase [Arcicella sp.]